MLSTVSNSVRVEPQQERTTRRLANFLDVAEVLFAEIGYEATTMTAIAERSGSGIGTLYHYFPDKQSMAFALLNQYAQEIEAYWKPLMEQAETLPQAAFAETFLDRITEFLRERPAFREIIEILKQRYPEGDVERIETEVVALLARLHDRGVIEYV